ncbi:MAG: methionine biosynthesis protein MetW [Burkholderiales bacterium]|jgi:methionine biosynthesis protein MetW|nr:methionine biosynthesis protein MetW [Burkholderiales bacterium]
MNLANTLQHYRSDLDLIEQWVPVGSRVLDLGCGDGSLLARLKKNRQVTGYGVEINDAKVWRCIQNGVNVIQQDLEAGLAMFDDQSFDVVILSLTLQSMRNTEEILKEISRVGRVGIVSFPNFGHWFHVWSIATGHMPVSKHLPYEWFNTPNIHLCTVADFEILAQRIGLRITGREVFANGKVVNFLPNLRGTLAVFSFTSIV